MTLAGRPLAGYGEPGGGVLGRPGSVGYGVIVIVGEIGFSWPGELHLCRVAPSAGRASGRILITESVNLMALRDVILA